MIEMFSSGLLVPFLAALAFGGIIYALAYPYFSGDRQKDRRVESVAGVRARKLTGVAAEIQSSRKKSVADSLKEMEDRQKADKKVTMGLRLIRAGLNRTPRDFYMASAVLGGLLGAVSLLLLGLPAWVVYIKSVFSCQCQDFLGFLSR